MEKLDILFWLDACLKLIDEVEKAVKPLVGTSEASEILKIGADGTPTKFIDQVAEDKVVEVLNSLKKPLFLVSEEIGEIKIGEGPIEAILVVDPLDGTSNAVKNIPAFGISIAVAEPPINRSPSLDDLKIGVVKNFATGDIYHAIRGKGAALNGAQIHSSKRKDLSSSSIGSFIYRGDMNRLEPLCKTVRRMRTLGSVAIEICYVSDATYDAFLDIKGNIRIVDLAAAMVIVEESGGMLTDQKCQPLKGNLNVLEKTSLIASGNIDIHKDIVDIIGGI